MNFTLERRCGGCMLLHVSCHRVTHTVQIRVSVAFMGHAWTANLEPTARYLNHPNKYTFFYVATMLRTLQKRNKGRLFWITKLSDWLTVKSEAVESAAMARPTSFTGIVWFFKDSSGTVAFDWYFKLDVFQLHDEMFLHYSLGINVKSSLYL